ncbi:DUF2141 domain-containing protein [Flavitalea sp. BT771]|uniref:DUF2141 domain-containing protein n=1 Tax=Flavitalea sp. BT771 TaxID=3063329 RepID=UPI0026E1552B|nr:DUF2141 domain-containing protein [Flavitalea sp. BT771]MDO6432821.1 DUF2141 domain-containing protein [Flavitalea sp. BT771]MDV6221903.1 DUF2141 domain-containing protein [Flavitalea sp. BT771]
MRRLLLSMLSLSLSFAGRTQLPVKVKVDKLSGRTGSIYLAVYNSAATYMDPQKCLRSKITAVKNVKTVLIDLGELPAGRYAIALFLDENGNGQIDKNILGIPKERYGFSGNRHPWFRAPDFEEAAIDVDATHTTVSISLR